MNFQQLRSIRETVRRNFNLTEVANALYTSQPGVSRQIREIEDELGVEIFERYGKRLVGLTPPGVEIVKIVERLLAEAQNLKQAAEEFSGKDSGRLVIATTHTQARYALPPVVVAFRERFPHVTLALQQASPAHIVELLRSGEADIGFASEALAQQPDFVVFEAYRWHHVVLAPKGHPLAGRKGLSLADLAEYPLITYDEGFTGRQRIDEAFETAGLAPRIVLTAMDSDVIKTYVELGMGVGIIAAMAWDEKKDSGFERIDEPGLFGENAALIGVRRGAYLRSFAIDFIQQLAPNYSRNGLLASVLE